MKELKIRNRPINLRVGVNRFLKIIRLHCVWKAVQLILGIFLTLFIIAHPGAQEIKDPYPPSQIEILMAPMATGGPDTMGYTYADQNAGIPFQWVEISGTGTPVTFGDDVSSSPISLDQPFRFYGTIYTNVVMASNGYLSTDRTDTGGSER